MSVIGRLLEKRTLSHADIFGTGGQWRTLGSDTHAGAEVDPQSAERLTSVYACVDLISGVHAQLPTWVTEDDQGGRRQVQNQPRWLLAPNPESTWQGFVEQFDTSILTHGNAYIQVIYDRSGRVAELWPLDPSRIVPQRAFEAGVVTPDPLEPVFSYTTEDGRYIPAIRSHNPMLPPELRNGTIMHVKNRSRPGALLGLSPIAQAKEAIGLGLTVEEYGAKFFKNGATAGVVLEFPGTPDRDVVRRMLDEWEERHKGAGNAHRPAATYAGASMKPLTIPPQEAQFLELRRFQVAEIARLFRVPPHMIGDVQGSTSYGQGVEFQSIAFVQMTMQPHLVRLEQAVEKHLLRDGRQLRTDTDALVRGDIKTRYEAHEIAIRSGFETINEARASEDLPRTEGGDQLYLPFNNLAPVDRINELIDAQVSAANTGISAPDMEASADET